MAKKTTFSEFCDEHGPEVRRAMVRMGVTCNRVTIERILLYDLWVAETVRRNLSVCDSASWISKQCSMSYAESTSILPGCTTRR